MPQHVGADGLDVLRRDVAAAADEGVRPRRLRQVERRPGRGAVLDEIADVEARTSDGSRVAKTIEMM